MRISTPKKLHAWRKRIEQAAYAVAHSHGVRLGYSVGKAQGYESALRDLIQQTLAGREPEADGGAAAGTPPHARLGNR
jgi:hypothetical protein